jgi:hypothetical protein
MIKRFEIKQPLKQGHYENTGESHYSFRIVYKLKNLVDFRQTEKFFYEFAKIFLLSFCKFIYRNISTIILNIKVKIKI